EVRLTIPSSDSTRKLLEPAGGDRGLPLEPEIIAYCSPTAATNNITLRIILGAHPVTDSRCVGFARLGNGQDVIRAIHEAPAGVTAFVSSVETSHGPASR